MDYIWKFLIFTSFVYVCSAQFTCNNMVQTLAECSSNHLSKMPEIAQNLRGTTDFIAAAVTIPHWRTMCQYQSDVKAFFTCSLNAINNCIEDDYIGMYPDPNKFNQGFEYGCSQLNDIDVGCYQVNIAPIHTCATRAAGNPPTSSSSSQDMISYNCRLFQEERTCTENNLETCQETRKIVETYLSYLARPVCGAVSFSSSLVLSAIMICFSLILRH